MMKKWVYRHRGKLIALLIVLIFSFIMFMQGCIIPPEPLGENATVEEIANYETELQAYQRDIAIANTAKTFDPTGLIATALAVVGGVTTLVYKVKNAKKKVENKDLAGALEDTLAAAALAEKTAISIIDGVEAAKKLLKDDDKKALKDNLKLSQQKHGTIGNVQSLRRDLINPDKKV